MEHKRYERVAGVWNKKEVEYLCLMGFTNPTIQWCITEKIHGSNFTYYINKDEIKVASRNGFLSGGKDFFQYSRMDKKTSYKMVDLWYGLISMGEELEEVVVYGELFGGSYPHPDVEQIPTVKRIQKGVYYSNDIEFYCFDIMINGKFIDMKTVEMVCDFSDIFYTKILFSGTFEDCVNYSNKFQTTIPERLGFPPIDDNICEGIVIKPIEPLYYPDESRVIFKSKNEKFLETSKEPKQIREKINKLSDSGRKILEEISKYVTKNRLDNVLSKIGSFTKKDFAKIHTAFRIDIFEDYIRDYGIILLDSVDMKCIKKVIGKICTDIWRPVFLANMEIDKK